VLVEAILKAGYVPGKDVGIGLDPAVSGLYHDGHYVLKGEGRTLGSVEMVELWTTWLDRYPIVSLEDGMAEEDWDGWTLLTEKLGDRVQLVGDDNFVTNAKLLQKGIDLGAANSVLIKLTRSAPSPRPSRRWLSAVPTATTRWSATAAARPRTPSSRTSWSPSTAARSRPGRRPGRSGSPSTTGCSASSASWAAPRSSPARAPCRGSPRPTDAGPGERPGWTAVTHPPSPLTVAARAGTPDPAPGGVPLVEPPSLASVDAFPDLEDLDAAMAAGRGGYRRFGNPSVHRLEEALVALEGYGLPEPPVCRVTSSGQAALLLALSTLVGPGRRRVVLLRPCYGGSESLIAGRWPPSGSSR